MDKCGGVTATPQAKRRGRGFQIGGRLLRATPGDFRNAEILGGSSRTHRVPFRGSVAKFCDGASIIGRFGAAMSIGWAMPACHPGPTRAPRVKSGAIEKETWSGRDRTKSAAPWWAARRRTLGRAAPLFSPWRSPHSRPCRYSCAIQGARGRRGSLALNRHARLVSPRASGCWPR